MCDLEIDAWPWKTTGHLFYNTSSFVHDFKTMGVFKLEFKSENAKFRSKWAIFLSRLTLKVDRWPLKTIGHLFYIASSFVHHFIAMGEFKLELQTGNAQFGSKSTIFEPCDLEIWRMTLKNNRTHLLSNIKLCASFHHHVWIQTGVTVWKRLSWVLTSVTLTFDFWPWTFVSTSLLSMVIIPENFMMIRWWEHSQKGVTDKLTDGQTDRQTEPFIELLGRSQKWLCRMVP